MGKNGPVRAGLLDNNGVLSSVWRAVDPFIPDEHAAANLFKSILFRTLWILWCSRASPLPIAAANKSNR
jgi:hypothetical protein